MKDAPRPSFRSATELERRLARDAARLPAPSPDLRPRILAALHEERARPRPPQSASASSTGGPAWLAMVAAAALVCLLLWDPGRFSRIEPPQGPGANLTTPHRLAGRFLGWTKAVPPARDVVDRPLRTELDHLVADTTRVAEGIASRVTASPLGRFFPVGESTGDSR